MNTLNYLKKNVRENLQKVKKSTEKYHDKTINFKSETIDLCIT